MFTDQDKVLLYYLNTQKVITSQHPLKLEPQSDPKLLFPHPQSQADTVTWIFKCLVCAPSFAPLQPLSWISPSHFVLDHHSHSLSVFFANDLFPPQFILNTVVQKMALNRKSMDVIFWLKHLWKLPDIVPCQSVILCQESTPQLTSHLNFSLGYSLSSFNSCLRLFSSENFTLLTPQWKKSPYFSIPVPVRSLQYLV